MVFKASPCPSRWEGILVTVWLLIFDGLMLLWAMRRPVDWLKFAFVFAVVLTIPLLVHWIYRTWIAFSLEYWVDRNAVTLHWANVRQVLPLHEIKQIVRAGVPDLGGTSWIYWPAPHVRPGRGLGLTDVRMAASHKLDDCLVLETGRANIALSPADRTGFVDAMQARFAMGPAQIVQPTAVRESLLERIGRRYRPGLILLGIGLLGVLVLVGLLMVNFPNLPDALALQYNSDGIPVVIRNKSALFILPIIGFIAWVVNGIGGFVMLGREQPTGAYMLWGGTLVVQICSLLALVSILP
ncbi:MAG: hypothetical protein KDD78_16465 [Caldilineaceae bacterium]|nr:hypothetical protein [Caldilineaceae bacterium]